MTSLSPPPKSSSRWVGITWNIFRIVAVCYLGVLLVFFLLENRLVFQPFSASEYWDKKPVAEWQDVFLEIEDATKIHGWWCPYPEAEGALLYCHGNGGNLSHRGGPVQRLQKELRVSVLIFDYPGYGRSEGSPTEKGCYAAGEAAFRWLTDTQKIPPEKILLYGISLGCGVATHLAIHHPHRALVLASPFTSLPNLGQQMYPWLPVRWLMRNRFDNLSRITQCKRPVFITHGDMDGLIPIAHGKTLFAAANEPKCFHCMVNGTHDTQLDDAVFAKLKPFLEKHAPLAAEEN